MYRFLLTICLVLFVGGTSVTPTTAHSVSALQTGRTAEALIAAIDGRLALAIPVAAAKRVSGAPVEDPVREEQAKNAFLALVTPQGVPEAEATAFIEAQFSASKYVQRTLLRQWEDRPQTIPASDPPNLVTQVRPALDTATLELSQAFVDAWNASQKHPKAWKKSISKSLENPPGKWRWQKTAVRMAAAPIK